MADIEDFQLKYTNLLQQFNEYRETILKQKETQLHEFEKYRAHLDKTYKQVEKKYEAKLQEERSTAEKKFRKAEMAWRQKQEDLNSTIEHKNRFIEELKKRLGEHESEKHQIIEDHTHMENSEQNLGPHKNSYQDLVRLYQFVLDQNNSLKKELFKIELIQKQQGNDPQKQKASTSKAGGVRKEEKKKKGVLKSLDNSKTHNQSTRGKEQTVKREGNRRGS